MALSWIRVDNDLPDHPKSLALDEALGVERSWTHVVQLWLWTSRVAPTGNLSRMPDSAIASKAGWKKDAAVFVDALRQVGFLDSDGMLHDWHEYQGKMLERLEKDRERKRKPQKDSAGTPTELHRKSDGGPAEVQRTSTGNPLLQYETVRDGTVRDETKNQEMAPTADAAVPALEGKPVQEPLLSLPDKPKKPRKLTEEQIQANEWRSKALAIAGIPEAEAGPWPSEMFLAWKAQAKRRTVATMMRALDGIARMPPTEFVRKRGWTHWLAGEGIDAGLAAMSAPIASTGNGGALKSVREERHYSKPVEAPPVVEWTPESALERAMLLPDFLGPKRLIVPWGKSLPDGFQIPDGVVVVQGQKPVSTSPLQDSARGVA